MPGGRKNAISVVENRWVGEGLGRVPCWFYQHLRGLWMTPRTLPTEGMMNPGHDAEITCAELRPTQKG
jgi:hypothetical protein